MLRSLIAVCLSVLIALTVSAQDAAPLDPISTLTAGDFRALAVTADGSHLFAADAENRQVRVYDFTNPAAPVLLSSLDVSGIPVLLAGGNNFGLVAVLTEETSDAVEVLAPPLPNASGEFLSGNYISIGKAPRSLALSPDNRWGIAVSEASYTLLEINTAANIDSFPVDDALLGAALSNDTAYLLREQALDAAPLENMQALETEQSLALEGSPSAIALNGNASEGVIVVDGTQLVRFDAETLEATGSFTVEGGAVTSILYLAQGDSELLLVMQEGSSTVRFIDLDNLAEDESLTSLPSLNQALSRPVRALATYDGFLIVTDGVTISTFES
jgi:hypothetical protein